MKRADTVKDALAMLDELIPGLDLVQTKRGDELKGRARDLEDGGSFKFYLGADDCLQAARLLDQLSTWLRLSDLLADGAATSAEVRDLELAMDGDLPDEPEPDSLSAGSQEPRE